MNIFGYLDYRKFIDSELKKRKKSQPGFTQARFAEQTGIRNTYLSNVLKGRANLNSDQLDAVARQLNLGEKEAAYLFLLKELDQSIDPERQSRLREKIETERKIAQKTETHISAKLRRDEPELIMRYYSDPLIKIVHVLLTIPRFSKNPAEMRKDLNLSEEKLSSILSILEETGLIRFGEKEIEILQGNYHLPKESPMLLPHQMLMRNKSAQRLLEVSADRRYSFSASITATESVRQEIHSRFLDFLKQIEPLVKKAESEQAYQINFDLFPWTNET